MSVIDGFESLPASFASRFLGGNTRKMRSCVRSSDRSKAHNNAVGSIADFPPNLKICPFSSNFHSRSSRAFSFFPHERIPLLAPSHHSRPGTLLFSRSTAALALLRLA